MQGFRHLEEAITLDYDSELCIGCGSCLTVCPHQVFALEGKRLCSGIVARAWSVGPAP
jgi:Fe-S-cluster-containing hydrogenase component 2